MCSYRFLLVLDSLLTFNMQSILFREPGVMILYVHDPIRCPILSLLALIYCLLAITCYLPAVDDALLALCLYLLAVLFLLLAKRIIFPKFFVDLHSKCTHVVKVSASCGNRVRRSVEAGLFIYAYFSK